MNNVNELQVRKYLEDDLLLTGGVTKTLKEESILATEVQSSEISIHNIIIK